MIEFFSFFDSENVQTKMQQTWYIQRVFRFEIHKYLRQIRKKMSICFTVSFAQTFSLGPIVGSCQFDQTFAGAAAFVARAFELFCSASLPQKLPQILQGCESLVDVLVPSPPCALWNIEVSNLRKSN